MILPNFIIAGAPRSGTTYLYELLDSHPNVFLAKPRQPEPKFFLVDEEFEKGIEYYSNRYFAGAAGYAAVGEKSTNYLENAHVARRIYENLPDVGLVFVLRNPIDRAYSNYRWSVQNGHESLSFSDAVEQEAVRERRYSERLKYARPFSYVSRGRYAELLRPYFDLFRASQIKVLLLDEIEAAPEAAASELFEFLHLPATPLSFNFAGRVNSATAADPAVPLEVALQLYEIYSGPNADLATLLGRDLSCWDRPAKSEWAHPAVRSSPERVNLPIGRERSDNFETIPTFDANAICITSDVEWCHPQVLDYFLDLLDERNLRATLFCTHPGIIAREHEIALHPNFSLQGDTLQPIRSQLGTLKDNEVYRHVVATTCGWYPRAIGVRGHRQFFDSALLPLYRDHGIQYESGCYLPFARNLEPAMKPHDILEIPIYYIDYSDLSDNRSEFDVDNLNLSNPGLKVFNFHPNMVYINAVSLPHYFATKAYYHDPERLLAARHDGRGIGTLFVDLLDRIAEWKASTVTLSQVNAAWRVGRCATSAGVEKHENASITR